MIEGPNARDQTAFWAFHSFLVEVLTMLHTCNAYVITTWTLGLRAPLVAYNNVLYKIISPTSPSAREREKKLIT